MFAQDPDHAIYQRLRRHDPDTVVDLVQRHGRLLAHIIRGSLGPGPEEDVADVLSQVLFVVWTDIAEYDPQRARFRTWLVMKTRSEARGWRRKQKREWRVPPLPLDDSSSVYEEALRRADLTIALAELSETDRLIVYLCDFLERDHEGVATELGITRGTLNTRLHRIRKRLRSALGERQPRRRVGGGTHE